MSTRITGWISQSAAMRRAPTIALPASRETVLEALLDPSRLPSHPVIALRVVEAASRPDCRPATLVALLAQDPALCANLLRAVNSSAFGLSRPVTSIERAVMIAGMNRLRALALGLSLPTVRPECRVDPAAREHSLSSVGGAILARELAIKFRHPAPEDDLVAGLLRDLGELLLQQTFPHQWATLIAETGDPLGETQCAREQEVFGVDHAEVTAELLKKWKLPDDVVEPIRHHHDPDVLAGTPHAARAELLWFAGMLTRLEALVEQPAALDRILIASEERFRMNQAVLAEFLDGVVPKIDQFAQLLSRDIGQCPGYAAILRGGAEELARLHAAGPQRVGT